MKERTMYLLEVQVYAPASPRCGCPSYCEHGTWTDEWSVRNTGENLSALRGQATSIARRVGPERTRFRYMPLAMFVPLSSDRDEAGQLMERAMLQMAERAQEIEKGVVTLPTETTKKPRRRWHRDGSSCQRKACATGDHLEDRPSSGEAQRHRESITGVCETCEGRGMREYRVSGLVSSELTRVTCYRCRGTGRPL